MIAGGLVLLSQQYEWAERRVEPIKREALKGAAKSVETWPRIIATSTMIAAHRRGGRALVRRPRGARRGGRSPSAGGCPAARPRASRSSSRRCSRSGCWCGATAGSTATPRRSPRSRPPPSPTTTARGSGALTWPPRAAVTSSASPSAPPHRVALWCSTSTAPRGPTCSPTPSASCCRRRWTTRSRPSWCSCPRAGWSGGSASGSPTGSAPRRRGGDGVCAGVEFRFPRSLVAELTGTRDEDPWAPDALAWPLLSVLDDSLDEPWAATLAAPPRPPRHRRRGRVPARPPLRRRAAAGRPVRVVRRPAAAAARRLVRRSRPPTGSAASSTPTWPGSRRSGGRWPAAVGAPRPRRAARRDPRAAPRADPRDLPPRISLFGHTRMPATEIELLRALATHHDLHLWLPHPSADLWQRLADLDGPDAAPDDDSHRRVRHPLLASLGRDQRELQRSLGPAEHDDEVGRRRRCPDTLLGWLQADLRADAVRPDGRRTRPARPVGPGAPLPRPGPPGPGAARGAARAARGRPEPRAARHPRDVPRHRELRAADHRGVRPR